MWGAIKNDLFEFITTVQEDAHDTLSKVVDINPSKRKVEEEKITEEERILSEFRNNFATYAENVKEEHKPEFEKFLKSFSLSSKADEIEYILELENGIAKHYDALVPVELTPDLFWARYFFKVNILIISSLGSVLESAYDDDEELTWAEDEDNVIDRSIQEGKSCQSGNSEMGTESNPTLTDCYGKNGHEKARVIENDIEEATSLQETNIRIISLEREIAKLHQELMTERAVSDNLRNTLSQQERREKELISEVSNLMGKLEAIESVNAKCCNICAQKIEVAPPSTGSSVVVLDMEKRESTADPQEHIMKSLNQECHPSMSELSLTSLQSVSSVSTNSSPSSTVENKLLGVSNSAPRLLPQQQNNQQLSKMTENEVLDGDDEEWDNEAWD